MSGFHIINLNKIDIIEVTGGGAVKIPTFACSARKVIFQSCRKWPHSVLTEHVVLLGPFVGVFLSLFFFSIYSGNLVLERLGSQTQKTQK